MTAQDLKNSILQLAVEGKLLKGGGLPLATAGTPSSATPSAGTPRNAPSDPKTGAELLEQIKAEKARLIAEGKIKKDTTKAGASGRALEPITEDEKPFDIPENWCWVRLRDICTKIVDGDHNPPHGLETKTDYIMASSQNINFDSLVELDKVRYLSEEVFRTENERTRANEGDVFFTSVGTLGRSCVYTGGLNICFQRSVSVITTLIFNKYLKYFLDSPDNQSFIISNATGTAQKGFYLNQLEKLVVPLPPLAEQKRIVAKIEELLPYIQKYDVAHTKLEEFNKKFPVEMQKSILQQAIMGKLTEDWRNEQASLAKTNSAGQLADRSNAKDLLEKIKAEKAKSGGKATSSSSASKTRQKELPPITEEEIPFDIPESWCWCRLGEIGDWGAGATPQRGNPDYYQNGTIPWIKTGELNNGIVSEACEFITEKALNECSLRYNRVGDVLIAMYGATIGKLAIAGIELTTNQACCACTCHNGVYNKYLFYFLMSQKSVFEKKAEGGAQPNISREKIVKTLIPLPPLAEQKRIVAKIEELLPLCKKLVK